MLEGPHLLAAALDAGVPLAEVLASPRFLESAEGRELSARLGAPPLLVEEGLLSELADADSPQGVLATAVLPRPGISSLPVVVGGWYVFAEGLQDPGNVGAIARVAEAAGASALCLGGGSAHPNHPRALRASAGSSIRLPITIDATAESLRAHLGRTSPRFAALVPRRGTPLYDPSLLDGLPPESSIVLCIGSEGGGLSACTLEQADLRWTIPMAEPVESLNAAVAAALTLFELRRRRSFSRAVTD